MNFCGLAVATATNYPYLPAHTVPYLTAWHLVTSSVFQLWVLDLSKSKATSYPNEQKPANLEVSICSFPATHYKFFFVFNNSSILHNTFATQFFATRRQLALHHSFSAAFVGCGTNRYQHLPTCKPHQSTSQPTSSQPLLQARQHGLLHQQSLYLNPEAVFCVTP